MIGEKIYKILVERGQNPLELLRSLHLELPDDIEETDIDHKDRTEVSISLPLTNSYEHLDKVQLSDGSQTEVFYLNGTKILMKNGVEVGEYYYWVDSDMEIPKKYKNNENIVVDPTTGEKLYEYFLATSCNMYHDLDTEMLYREYKYDYGLDKFIRLSAVIR